MDAGAELRAKSPNPPASAERSGSSAGGGKPTAASDAPTAADSPAAPAAPAAARRRAPGCAKRTQVFDSRDADFFLELLPGVHQRKVLNLSSVAYEILPPNPASLSSHQAEFLEAAMAGLSENDKVVSVRLSVFTMHWYDSVLFCRWLTERPGRSKSDQVYADPRSPSLGSQTRDPLENWAFLNWPTDFRRRGFRLPTESEWEIACHEGFRTAFGFGGDDRLLAGFGWFLENSDKHMHAPFERRPSLQGLFDTHGNAYEWTHDWYDAPELPIAIDPIGPNYGKLRVLRGGSWGGDPPDCRQANRFTYTPSYRTAVNGLRLALTIAENTDKAKQLPMANSP